jgi:splicing factor 3B subunit 1
LRPGETPTPSRFVASRSPKTANRGLETPTPGKMKTRWDETPIRGMSNSQMATPYAYGVTPTPQGMFNMATPSPGILHSGMTPLGSITPDRFNLIKLDKEMEERNKPLTDEYLDSLLNIEGYELIKAPENYQPLINNKKIISTPVYSQTPLYQIPSENSTAFNSSLLGEAAANLNMRPEDVSFFSNLLNEVDESKLSPEEQRDRKIMGLLLKVKNGTPPIRKSALRQLTEKAREFGAGPLLTQILPLLMSPTLEDQERHLLVKVVDRILFKLDELVRPYVHKILVAIEPMLIDEDYYARVEGREIISNLAKAAGLATMISTMRPDIDHADEYVRNTTARAFAVVASALGIPSLLPFLKAVCQSKKSWQARHTGIKMVQQIAILMGCAVLPHLKTLVEIIEHGLKDDQQKVRTITALAIAALAEASYPYGIDSFATVIRHLFDGMKQYRGKSLASFFKAIGFIIPLMDTELAARSTKLVIPVLRREFTTPDEEMKKIILKVLKQCISTEGIEANYVRTDIKDDFFKAFWQRRMALERKNYKQLIETTVEIANKIGGAEILEKIVEYLKDEAEPFRKMTLECIEKVVSTIGVADINTRLEALLIDGLLFAFQEQTSEDTFVILNSFGAVVDAFGLRVKPYVAYICGTVQHRLNNRSAKIRQQACDLIVKISPVMKVCGEENLLCRLGVVLNEYLGEEYPEVLGSVIAALKAIVISVGMIKMTPPIKELLPRLTPILKNRHEKVQENVIDLVGRIADKGASFVSAKEWMRICFDLLELLKAHKKAIRRATVNTFGYIAKAIGPQDVLVTLLNNLKVQERQNRVCTTVAIAIVSETCGPYTVIPALMNEYRLPELNVQNGVLKSFSFLFEYIGEMAKDYVYAVVPLLEDALTDRDLVHRQTAAVAVKHLALGVAGLNCEDGLVHLMNFVWPNIFETSPHVINAVLEAVEGLRIGLGVNRMINYVLQGLFHPARRVRDAYWKIYNMMYIGSADALNAVYPQLPEDLPQKNQKKKNSYRSTELELFI